MKFFVLITAFIVLTSSAAMAVACYSPRHIEAEQGLRIHSELMVIALTCMKQPGQSDLYQKYQFFTQKNQSVLSAYESDLMAYFRASGTPKPEKEFHNLRTRLANKISTMAVNTSTVTFCKTYAPRIDTALTMDSAKFQRWARQSYADAPTSRKMCQ